MLAVRSVDVLERIGGQGEALVACLREVNLVFFFFSIF